MPIEKLNALAYMYDEDYIMVVARKVDELIEAVNEMDGVLKKLDALCPPESVQQEKEAPISLKEAVRRFATAVRVDEGGLSPESLPHGWDFDRCKNEVFAAAHREYAQPKQATREDYLEQLGQYGYGLTPEQAAAQPRKGV